MSEPVSSRQKKSSAEMAMNVEICTKAKILNHNDKILISQPASKNINNNIENCFYRNNRLSQMVLCSVKPNLIYVATTRLTEGAQTIFLLHGFGNKGPWWQNLCNSSMLIFFESSLALKMGSKNREFRV